MVFLKENLYMQWFALMLAIALNAVAHLVLKWGRFKANPVIPFLSVGPVHIDYFFLMGGFIFVCSLIAYYLALSKLQVSIAYPLLMSGGLLIVSVVSYAIFHERFTSLQGLGVLLLLIGVWLIH